MNIVDSETTVIQLQVYRLVSSANTIICEAGQSQGSWRKIVTCVSVFLFSGPISTRCTCCRRKPYSASNFRTLCRIFSDRRQPKTTNQRRCNECVRVAPITPLLASMTFSRDRFASALLCSGPAEAAPAGGRGIQILTPMLVFPFRSFHLSH